MAVVVEFLGIVKQRAGVAEVEIEAGTLGEVIRRLPEACPALAGYCIDEAGLKPGFLLSVGGGRFTRESGARLCAGERVLLLAADAGG